MLNIRLTIKLLLILCLFASPLYAGDTSNLEGAWLLNETSGTRYDETANNNDLTDNNTVLYTTGRFGNAADFERDNSEYLSITNAAQTGLDADGHNDITVGCWIKLESVSDSATYVIDRYDFLGSKAWTLNVSSAEQPYFLICEDSSCSSFNYAASSTIMQVDTWYHIVGTHDATGDEIGFYLDGTPVTPTSHTAGIPDVAVDFYISGAPNIATVYVDGVVDEAFFFSRKLSTSEIVDIQNNGIESFMTTEVRNRVIIIS